MPTTCPSPNVSGNDQAHDGRCLSQPGKERAVSAAVPSPGVRPIRGHRHLWLGPIRSTPAVARDAATEFLVSCGLGDLAEAAQQVVSELVTNAVLASRALIDERRPIPPPVGFSISADVGRVLVEVWDCSDLPPAVKVAGEFSEHGRGLLLVEAYADRWGWHPAPRGKCVWATITDSGQ